MAKQAASQARQNAAAQPAAQLSSHVCIQREARAQGVEPGALPLVKQALTSPARPLDASVRGPMEQRLGMDFSRVRVHTDPSAANSARAVHANAYTAGLDLVFADSKYAPATLAGQRLIAHELSHVAQQASGPVSGIPVGDGFSISMPGDAHERQAERAANFEPSTGHDGARPVLPQSIRPDLISRDGWDTAGAIAGIAGAAVGAVALGIAIAAWLRPKNPKAPGGAIALNPNPFQFNTAVQEPATNQDAYRNALQGEPRQHQVIDLRTDEDNHAEVNLALKTDTINVVDSTAEVGERQGYEGGSSGSSATINFSQTPLPTAGSQTATTLFAPAQAASGGGAAPPAAGTAQTAANTATPTPASPAAAEVLVRFTGMNINGNETPQGFSGEIQVKADDTVQCTHCRPTTPAHDNVEVRDGVAYIDFRPKPRPAAGGAELLGPSHEPSSHPGFQWPELPFNRPWTGSAGGGA